MRRLPTTALGLTLGLLLATTASGQYGYYPRGYGGYGWGGWGADPQSGYMAGLGAYARARGSTSSTRRRPIRSTPTR